MISYNPALERFSLAYEGSWQEFVFAEERYIQEIRIDFSSSAMGGAFPRYLRLSFSNGYERLISVRFVAYGQTMQDLTDEGYAVIRWPYYRYDYLAQLHYSFKLLEAIKASSVRVELLDVDGDMQHYDTHMSVILQTW